jgi:hypothetical protein
MDLNGEVPPTLIFALFDLADEGDFTLMFLQNLIGQLRLLLGASRA